MKILSVLVTGGISAVFLLAGCSASSSVASSKAVREKMSSEETPAAADPGEKAVFGSYQNEDIEWYVLKEEDGKALLLSVHALDSRPFSDASSTWDTSSLRAWLNDEFYQEAFSEEEKQEIQMSQLDNGDDLNYGTKAGENTEDHVFLLSASEAEQYLTKEEVTTSPTDYALSQGAYVNSEGNCAWWLRSPGMSDEGPAYYSSQGEIGTRAHKAEETIIGVRPAIWVSTSALKGK